MKICIVTNSLYGGGAERVVCNLANYLVEHDHEVKIILLSTNQKSYLLNNQVVVNYVTKKRIKSKLFLYKSLKQVVLTENSSCFVSFLPVPTIFMLSLRNKLNAPLICTERNDPRHYKFITRFLLKKLSHQADGFVFQTKIACAWYHDSINEIDSIIIPNAINMVQTTIKEGNEDKRIVSVGRLVKQKNFKLLISAFYEVHKKHPEYKLYIYGSGPLLNKLKKYVKRLYLVGFVLFKGFVTNILSELSKAEIFVLSSDFEGMPNALIEAMSIGKACVSTKCAGADDLINGSNGIKVAIGDKRGIESAVNYLIENPQKRIEFGENAKKISELLSPQNIYKNWEAYLTMISGIN